MLPHSKLFIVYDMQFVWVPDSLMGFDSAREVLLRECPNHDGINYSVLFVVKTFIPLLAEC
jgi:hypothetical protein